MMESKTTLLVAIALCLILCRAQEQQALGVPLYLSYEGNLTLVEDPFDRFNASVVDGAQFSGNYTYDPDVAIDSNPDPTLGAYSLGGELVADIGDMHFAATDIYAPVRNDYTAGSIIIDSFMILAQTLTSGNLPLFNRMSITISDDTATAFSSDALPTTLDLADFPYVNSFEIYADGVATHLYGDLTSLTLTPEPATLSLLALGGLAMLRRRRRRSCRRS